MASLRLSAYELQQITGWPDSLVEDYLSLERQVENVVNEVSVVVTEINNIVQESGSVGTLNRSRIVGLTKQLAALQAEIDELVDSISGESVTLEMLGSLRGKIIGLDKAQPAKIAAAVSLGI